MAFCVHRIVDGANDILVGARCIGNVFQVFGHSFAGDGHAITMQQTSLQQDFHDLWDAACTVQVHSQILTAGLQVTNDGNLFAHALEVVNGPLNTSGVRNGQEVQHSVGRSTGGHDDGHRIFNGFFGDDVAWLQIIFDGLNQYLGRCFGRVLGFVMGVGHGGGVGQ